MTIKELQEKRGLLVTNNQTIIDLMKSENRSMTTEEQTGFNTRIEEVRSIDTQLNLMLEHERQDARSATVVAGGNGTPTADSEAEQRSAFFAVLAGTATVEQRAAVVIDGVDGAVTVPTSIANKVIKAVNDRGNFLKSVTHISTTTGAEIKYPTTDSNLGRAKTVAAYKKVATTEKPTFGSIALGAFVYSTTLIPIDKALLQDSAVNVEQIIVDILSEQIANGYEYDAIHGKGTTEITGLMTTATSGIVAASATAITYNELVRLVASVKYDYSKPSVGAWVMNGATRVLLMGIVDNNNRPIFVQSPVLGEPDTILGRAVVISSSMEDIGADKKPIAFGDVKNYRFRTVVGLSVEVDYSKFREEHAIGVMASGRVDGKLFNAEAIKYLQMKATV